MSARIIERCVIPRSGALACLLWLVVCASAHAQDDSYARVRFSAELGAIRRVDTHETLWVTAPLLKLDYATSRNFGLGVDWGFLMVNESPRVGSALWMVGSGDPLFKLWHTRVSADGHDRLLLSAGISAPLAWLSYDIEKRAVLRSSYAQAAAMRGLWDVWLWGPEQVTLVLNAVWQHAFGRVLRFTLAGSVAASTSVSRVTYDDFDAYAQVAPTLALHSAYAELGVRGQAVFFTSSSDVCQLSVSPFVSLALGREVTLSARALLNLDPPLGLFGSGLHTWAGLLSLEGAL